MSIERLIKRSIYLKSVNNLHDDTTSKNVIYLTKPKHVKIKHKTKFKIDANNKESKNQCNYSKFYQQLT